MSVHRWEDIKRQPQAQQEQVAPARCADCERILRGVCPRCLDTGWAGTEERPWVPCEACPTGRAVAQEPLPGGLVAMLALFAALTAASPFYLLYLWLS